MRCSCAFLSECWGKFAFAVRPLVSGPGEPATPEPLNSGILTASILPKRCHRPLSFGASSPLIRGRLGGRKFLRLLNFRSMILAVSYQTARSNPLAGLILFRARGENDSSSNRVRSVPVCRCNCGRRVHSHSCVDCSRRSARTKSTLKTDEVSAPLLLVADRRVPQVSTLRPGKPHTSPSRACAPRLPPLNDLAWPRSSGVPRPAGRDRTEATHSLKFLRQ
jgi:hypothetical protein